MSFSRFGSVMYAGLFISNSVAAPIRPERPPPAISVQTAAKVQQLRQIDSDVYRIARVHGRGELAFVRWQQPIEIIDDVKFHPVRKIAEGKKPIHFAASRDGVWRAWGENNSRIHLENIENGKSVAIETGNDQSTPAFSIDSKILATGGYGERVKLWDTNGKPVRELDCGGKGGLWPVFSPDGKVLAVGNRNDDARLFDLASGNLLHVLPKKMTQELAFNPDGSVLAVGYVDGSVALWDTAKGQLLQEAPSGSAEIFTVDWTPRGDVLVTAGLAGKIVLWDAHKLTKLKELAGPGWVISARFTADGTRLLSAGADESTGKVNRQVLVWGLSK